MLTTMGEKKSNNEQGPATNTCLVTPCCHSCQTSQGGRTWDLADDCVRLETPCLQGFRSCMGSMGLTQLRTLIRPWEWGLMGPINPAFGKDSAAKRTGIFQDTL